MTHRNFTVTPEVNPEGIKKSMQKHIILDSTLIGDNKFLNKQNSEREQNSTIQNFKQQTKLRTVNQILHDKKKFRTIKKMDKEHILVQ